MITGLLFALSQKPLVPANDDQPEGRAFPSKAQPKPMRRVRPRNGLVTMARALSLILAVVGAGLLIASSTPWTFDPAQGLRIEAVAQNLIRHMGVNS
jgi:hypothetical protein